jgi:hypothetical protein
VGFRSKIAALARAVSDKSMGIGSERRNPENRTNLDKHSVSSGNLRDSLER